MEHATKGQNNLNADANALGAPIKTARNWHRTRGLMTHWQEQSRSHNKVNRPADSGILIPARLSLEGEAHSGSEINRNDASRCDQNLTNNEF